MTARTGPRRPMLLGLGLGALGFLGLLLAGRGTPYPALVPPLAAIGFGTALTMPAAVAAVVESAPAHRTGLASGAFHAARRGRQCGGRGTARCADHTAPASAFLHACAPAH
ncbi:MFS transporter [Streptomyces sp. NPDC053560]|uniref:MFS transporter n=1 Tax=Streptomyces sp. NPDC053560 TaxID=3365711 RepID=UPI0037D3FE1F